ncbi:unnamed protein product [Arctia plantaginis]|uniref:Uncharacterized protein n=1 Tax=Arctia plantaginis TaxID=874455 RepID=A0A8S1BTQ3_ARCPL|nr:unnamed protein product [Arctia plantaginis]
MNIEELENYASMVLQQAIDARRQRILLKRERAKQEYIEQQLLIESEEKKSKTKEESPPETANSDEEVEADRKKPKLDIPDSKTIISNVFRYLDQEYKFLQLQNDDNPDLRPLAAITQRTSNATGVSPVEVRSIVREDRAKKAEKRKSGSQKQSSNDSSTEDSVSEGKYRITTDSSAERKISSEGNGADKH